MSGQRVIEVFADWEAVGGPTLMGRLSASLSRGREIFSFEYDGAWLGSAHRAQLDPTLGFYGGPQYPFFNAGGPFSGVPAGPSCVSG